MISAVFYMSGGALCGFSVSGHAGFAEAGRDIVCAGVSSAVELTVNAITEVLQQSPAVYAGADEVKLLFSKAPDASAASFLKALQLELTLLSQEYPDCVTCSEAQV